MSDLDSLYGDITPDPEITLQDYVRLFSPWLKDIQDSEISKFYTEHSTGLQKSIQEYYKSVNRLCGQYDYTEEEILSHLSQFVLPAAGYSELFLGLVNQSTDLGNKLPAYAVWNGDETESFLELITKEPMAREDMRLLSIPENFSTHFNGEHQRSALYWLTDFLKGLCARPYIFNPEGKNYLQDLEDFLTQHAGETTVSDLFKQGGPETIEKLVSHIKHYPDSLNEVYNYFEESMVTALHKNPANFCLYLSLLPGESYNRRYHEMFSYFLGYKEAFFKNTPEQVHTFQRAVVEGFKKSIKGKEYSDYLREHLIEETMGLEDSASLLRSVTSYPNAFRIVWHFLSQQTKIKPIEWCSGKANSSNVVSDNLSDFELSVRGTLRSHFGSKVKVTFGPDGFYSVLKAVALGAWKYPNLLKKAKMAADKGNDGAWRLENFIRDVINNTPIPPSSGVDIDDSGLPDWLRKTE